MIFTLWVAPNTKFIDTKRESKVFSNPGIFIEINSNSPIVISQNN